MTGYVPSEWWMPLHWSRPPLSMNRERHWADHRRKVAAIRDEVLIRARIVALPKIGGPVTVTLHWVPAVNRRRDLDNVFPSLKPCIDALVEYGLVPDDTHDYVTPQVRIHGASKTIPRTSRVWLEVEYETTAP